MNHFVRILSQNIKFLLHQAIDRTLRRGFAWFKVDGLVETVVCGEGFSSRATDMGDEMVIRSGQCLHYHQPLDLDYLNKTDNPGVLLTQDQFVPLKIERVWFTLCRRATVTALPRFQCPVVIMVRVC